MTREDPLDVASELESLLQEEGHETHALSILADLQQALRDRSESSDPSASDYTRSRAHALRNLALKLKSLVRIAHGGDMTYADKAKALAVVSDNYLKLVHAFKTDHKMWSLAQSELVPMVSQVSDEEGIVAALRKLESHLETYLVSLDFWLGKQ